MRLFRRSGKKGFSLIEVITVLCVVGILSAIAVPSLTIYYEKSCMTAAISEITGMIKEAKLKDLGSDGFYGVGFDPSSGRVSLISDKGPDGKWNTADDKVVRSSRLADKRGGLRFCCGGHGSVVSGLAVPADGVSFQNNNTIICNSDLTGTAGVVYLLSGSGIAMAISLNSTEAGYKIYFWNGNKWQQK